MNRLSSVSNDLSSLDISGFLTSGAFVAMGNAHVLLGITPNQRNVQPKDGPVLYAPDFFMRDPNPWFDFEQTALVEKQALVRRLREFPSEPWRVVETVQPSKALFEASFGSVMDGLKSGEYEKVVPYGGTQLRAVTGTAQIVRALCRLLTLPPQLIPYGLWDGNGGILGATPELLLEKNGHQVASMAVAGTRSRDSKKASLLEDEKQLFEHGLVVRSVEKVLGRFGKVRTEPLAVKTLLYLEHLATKISATLDSDVSFSTLVRTLHPTPALGANPKGAADAFLVNLDGKVPRKRFGAPFGWCMPDGDCTCTVAIRNAQWDADNIIVLAGCGVVAASRLDDEWAELLAKLDSTRKILGL